MNPIHMSAAEYHARWALMECNPCKDCSPEYRGKFAELKALVEAADMIFDRAYEAYGRLTEVSQTERLYEQRDEKI